MQCFLLSKISSFTSSQLYHISQHHINSLTTYPSGQPKSPPLFPQLLKLIPQTTRKIPSHNFTGSTHIYTYGGDLFLRKCVSLTVMQEGNQILRQPPTEHGGYLKCSFGCRQGQAEGQEQALSFKKISHVVIKLTTFRTNQTNMLVCVSSKCISHPFHFLP